MFLKNKNFKKELNIAIFGHFAKAIVKQNAYKMIDFGNEVLVNQIDDWSACMLKKLAPVTDVNTVVYSLDSNQFISFSRIW